MSANTQSHLVGVGIMAASNALPAASLLLLLPPTVLEKAAEDGSSTWASVPVWQTQRAYRKLRLQVPSGPLLADTWGMNHCLPTAPLCDTFK